MTTPRWNRRLIAGVGTGALAATTMAGLTLGAGDAHAAPITADGSVRVYNYTLLPNSQQWVDTARTVSESSVDQGETVTITTAISVHSNGPGWSVTLETLEDWTPACLAYVPGSGKATAVNTIGGPASVNATDDGTHITADTPGAGWGLGTGGAVRTVTLKADYKVNCAPGQHNTGGLNAYTSPSSDGANGASGDWLDKRSTGTGVANPPSGLKNSGPTITVNTPPVQGVPGKPTTATISPSVTTPNGVVTVSGTAAADTDTVVVKVGNTAVNCTPATVAANGSFSCTFPATTSGAVTVAGKNNAGVGTATSAGTLTVNTTEPGAPVVTVNPDPEVGKASTISVDAPAGAAGDTVTITAGGQTLCADLTLGADGKATCSWTPSTAGDTELKVTVNGKTTTTNLTVATASGGNGDGGSSEGNGDGGSSEGSSGSSEGSLSGLFGSS